VLRRTFEPKKEEVTETKVYEAPVEVIKLE
jgi:hypothetical protein